jgi:hypothetical protein
MIIRIVRVMIPLIWVFIRGHEICIRGIIVRSSGIAYWGFTWEFVNNVTSPVGGVWRMVAVSMDLM